MQKKQERRDTKDKGLQILVQFAELSWESVRETNVLWIWVFFISFCFVEMFQSSFNCESSLKFFLAEFSVEFSFSCLTW